MKKLLPLLALCSALSMGLAPLAQAAEGDAKTAQQTRMGSCNKEATGKSGDDRKAFMKECLSTKKATPVTQQSKMTSCNADAKGKTGEARKTFMKACLSG